MKRTSLTFIALSGLLVASLFLTSCQTSDPGPASSASVSAAPLIAGDATSTTYSPDRTAKERTGLGTGWGEDRYSQVSQTRFDRGGDVKPWSTGKLYYDTEAGARAMAADDWGITWHRTGPFKVASETLSVGLKNSRGRYLRSFSSNRNRYYVGEEGDRYVISLKNLTPSQLEVVVSVDGLDVLDGKPASYSKRGYLLQPHSSLEIEGFRRSDSTVAAFKFSHIANSYAAQTSGDRNVGVIGFAVFPEGGRRNPKVEPEVHLRRTADPFATSYAVPPGL